jgi:hypothetical protein
MIPIVRAASRPLATAPLFEVGKIAYQGFVKGEERTGEDYEDAAERGIVSGMLGEAKKAAVKKVSAETASRLAEPVFQHAVKRTWAQTVSREVASGTPVFLAWLRTGETLATKAAARSTFIGKAVGSGAGVALSPVVEVGQVAYRDFVKGEERTREDYAQAVKRGAASGAAGAVATACAAGAVGSVVPGLGTAAGFIAGLLASGYVNKLMTPDSP